MTQQTTAEQIERLLRDGLDPLHFEIEDQSASHAGHPGAAEGGGHFRIVVVARGFDGLTPIERQRRVHHLLDGLIGRAVHALSMRTLTPEEWKP